MVLKEKNIGPMQLKKILEVLKGKGVSYLDVSQNYLGDSGLELLEEWVPNE